MKETKMRKLVLILAAFALVPTMAAADDLSANLSGGCQGFASLVTSGSTITYGIITDNANAATAMLSGGASVNLQATFTNGSAAGSVAATAQAIAAMNNNPGSVTLTVSGGGSCSGTLVNNGATAGGEEGSFELSMSDYQVLENGGQVTVSVQRNGDAGAVSVDYATSNGTAIAGVDYTSASGTLSWDDGDGDAMTFTVDILDNADEDGNRQLNLTLSNPTGGAEIGLSAATVTIFDDEALVCVADDDTACLGADGRFRVEVEFEGFPPSSPSGSGQQIDLGLRDSALFYFFSEDNAEMLVKVLDFCAPPFNSYFVFMAATTNVEFTLTVTDTQAPLGASNPKVYANALGVAAQPVQDPTAFLTCP
jgi:Calx-beta domain